MSPSHSHSLSCEVQPEIFARRKFSPISPPPLIGEKFICNVFSCVKDCIADMVTFTAIGEILFLKDYQNTKIAGLGKNFIPRKFSAIQELESE